jgi:hypothetical protein
MPGEPNSWRVDSIKMEWDERNGQIVVLKPEPAPGASQVSGIKAPLGTLVHRVKRGGTG